VGVARYQFICVVHGPCGAAPIRRNSVPTERHCWKCGRVAELWIGETAPPMTAVRGAAHEDGQVGRSASDGSGNRRQRPRQRGELVVQASVLNDDT
jgi:hypothetical protein